MDGTSYPEILVTERRRQSAAAGLLTGIVLSLLLWAAIAGLVLFLLGRL